VSKVESKIFGVVKPDEEHLLWPFEGSWRDELGFTGRSSSPRAG
jgi:hypothetical protein